MKKCLLPLKADLEPATALIRRYVLAGTKKPVPVSRHRESTLFFPKVKKMTGILYGRHESVLTSFRMLPLLRRLLRWSTQATERAQASTRTPS